MDSALYPNMVTGDLIPGLPDDLALRCLAKISHGYHGLLQCVSKKWRQAMRSTEYANLKSYEGWCGNWLFAFTNPSVNYHCMVYDPDANKWHHIPPFDNSKLGKIVAFSCVTVCKWLLVIGGRLSSPNKPANFAINDVVMFDPFKQKWRNVSTLRVARSNFACDVINNKVYVAGGTTGILDEGLISAEVYDPYKDRWDELPQMPFPLVECMSVSHGGKFHVVGKKASNFEYDTYFIFDPTHQKWQIVEGDLLPFSKLWLDNTTIIDGFVYTILDDDSVKVFDTSTRDWITIGMLPSVVLQGHARYLKPFAYSVVGYKNFLYVLGGSVLKYDTDAHGYNVVELSSVRFCDPTIIPLEWHEAESMPAPASYLVGCSLVED